jgi:hypothetical protein
MDWDLMNQCMIRTALQNNSTTNTDTNHKLLISHHDRIKQIISLQCTFVAACVHQAKMEAQVFVHEEQTYELRKTKYFRAIQPNNVSFKIGFIGCGSMGRAIVDTLLDYIAPDSIRSNQSHGVINSLNTHQELVLLSNQYQFSTHNIFISTRRAQNLYSQISLSNRFYGKKYSQLGVNICEDNSFVLSNCDLVYLCIQPSQLKFAQTDIKSSPKCLLCSIIAGVSKDTIEKSFKSSCLVCCDSPVVMDTGMESDFQQLLGIQKGTNVFGNEELIQSACPSVYNTRVHPEDNSEDRLLEEQILSMNHRSGKEIQRIAFFQQLYGALITVYETNIPLEEAIRLAIFSMLRIDISPSDVSNCYEEILKENLFSSEKQYKTVHFVKKL